jgi:hypothetical protein
MTLTLSNVTGPAADRFVADTVSLQNFRDVRMHTGKADVVVYILSIARKGPFLTHRMYFIKSDSTVC